MKSRCSATVRRNTCRRTLFASNLSQTDHRLGAMQRAGQRVPLATFANIAAGHKKFIRWVTKGDRTARVCLEATGITAWSLCLPSIRRKGWR